MDQIERFAELQKDLSRVLPMNRPGSGEPHLLVILPSFSVGETLLSHYGPRIRALEHRYLNGILTLQRIESCRAIFVCTRAPAPEVIDAYAAMLAPEKWQDAMSRFTLLTLADQSPRAVADKLLDDPSVLDQIKALAGGLPGFIEPWNVTQSEVEVALQLGMPINGCAPELRPLGYKSAGRKLIRAAGVPVPFGFEDVRNIDDLIAAIEALRRERPQAPGAVVKHDDSGAGDGNVVVRFDDSESWRQKIAALPEWYIADLAKGGIVEELVAGTTFTSPSVQVDIRPGEDVQVLATHEQLLGGESNQVYMGCRFPADPAYAPLLARHGEAVGKALATAGVMGRFSMDFAASRSGGEPWRLYGLEVNLRKGGTTHPFAALRNLVPGAYDSKLGQWRGTDGTLRSYASTDNMVDPAWTGLEPGTLLAAFRRAGLLFNPASGTGIVPHMLACLEIDGRFGVTAIGTTPEGAQDLLERTRLAAEAAAGRG